MIQVAPVANLQHPRGRERAKRIGRCVAMHEFRDDAVADRVHDCRRPAVVATFPANPDVSPNLQQPPA